MSKEAILGSRAGIGEDAHEPLDRLGEGAPALVVAGLAGQAREQVTQMLAGSGIARAGRRQSRASRQADLTF